MLKKTKMSQIDLGLGQFFTILIFLTFMVISFDNTIYPKKQILF